MEASEVRFLPPLLGISLRDEIRKNDTRKQLRTEQMVEEI
jgi:hypothetical protein